MAIKLFGLCGLFEPHPSQHPTKTQFFWPIWWLKKTFWQVWGGVSHPMSGYRLVWLASYQIFHKLCILSSKKHNLTLNSQNSSKYKLFPDFLSFPHSIPNLFPPCIIWKACRPVGTDLVLVWKVMANIDYPWNKRLTAWGAGARLRASLMGYGSRAPAEVQGVALREAFGFWLL